LAEPLARQPEAASASLDNPPRTIRLRGSIARADVDAVCARASDDLGPGDDLGAGHGHAVVCDLAGLDLAGMPIVDVLARLALLARRGRRRLLLEHASPAILELLALCGLSEVLPCGPDSGGEVGR
jgi:STAS domain